MEQKGFQIGDVFTKPFQYAMAVKDVLFNRVSTLGGSGDTNQDIIDLGKSFFNGEFGRQVGDTMYDNIHKNSQQSGNVNVNTDINTVGNTVTSNSNNVITNTIITQNIVNYIDYIAASDDDKQVGTLHLYDLLRDKNLRAQAELRFPTIKEYRSLLPFAQTYKEMGKQFTYQEIILVLFYFNGR